MRHRHPTGAKRIPDFGVKVSHNLFYTIQYFVNCLSSSALWHVQHKCIVQWIFPANTLE